MESNKENYSDLIIYIGIGILCYGIMASMCIWLLCNILKWNNILYALVVMTAFCIGIVIYSIIKVVKFYNKNQSNGK